MNEAYCWFDHLLSRVVDLCEPMTLYTLKELRAASTELVAFGDNEYLAIFEDGAAGVAFGLFTFVLGPARGETDTGEYKCVFQGYGYSPGLREMRHVWFAPDESPDCKGYVYYPPIDAIAASFAYLKRYFD